MQSCFDATLTRNILEVLLPTRAKMMSHELQPASRSYQPTYQPTLKLRLGFDAQGENGEASFTEDFFLHLPTYVHVDGSFVSRTILRRIEFFHFLNMDGWVHPYVSSITQ